MKTRRDREQTIADEWAACVNVVSCVYGGTGSGRQRRKEHRYRDRKKLPGKSSEEGELR
jgi:hypothetical protein